MKLKIILLGAACKMMITGTASPVATIIDRDKIKFITQGNLVYVRHADTNVPFFSDAFLVTNILQANSDTDTYADLDAFEAWLGANFFKSEADDNGVSPLNSFAVGGKVSVPNTYEPTILVNPEIGTGFITSIIVTEANEVAAAWYAYMSGNGVKKPYGEVAGQNQFNIKIDADYSEAPGSDLFWMITYSTDIPTTDFVVQNVTGTISGDGLQVNGISGSGSGVNDTTFKFGYRDANGPGSDVILPSLYNHTDLPIVVKDSVEVGVAYNVFAKVFDGSSEAYSDPIIIADALTLEQFAPGQQPDMRVKLNPAVVPSYVAQALVKWYQDYGHGFEEVDESVIDISELASPDGYQFAGNSFDFLNGNPSRAAVYQWAKLDNTTVYITPPIESNTFQYTP